jgi:hypothetical protein
VVAEDGTIFFPYVGVIKAQGKTTSELRAILSAKLAKYIERFSSMCAWSLSAASRCMSSAKWRSRGFSR